MCLLTAGYEDIEDLESVTDEELLSIRNLNEKGVAEIRAAIDEYFSEEDEPEEEENEFEDITIFHDNGEIEVTVDFCGLEFDEYSETITISIWASSSSEATYKIWIKDLCINGTQHKQFSCIGSVADYDSDYLEQEIDNVDGINYEDIRRIKFLVEIDDEDDNELANSKVVILSCNVDNEKFSVESIEDYKEDVIIDDDIDWSDSKGEDFDSDNNPLNLNINEVEFSVRSYNCLKRAGINTIGDLCDMTLEDMSKVRNLGRKSLEEILSKLKDLGLSLKESDEENDDTGEVTGETVTDMPIEELEFSVRTYNCLTRAGIKTLGDICKKTPEDMMKVRNLGRKSLEEVLAKIKEYGLSLAGSDDVDNTITYEENRSEYPKIKEFSGSLLPVEYDSRIKVDVEAAFWKLNGTIYSPSINLRITNTSNVKITSMQVKASFFHIGKKDTWGDDSDWVVTGSNQALQPGYNKSAFLKGEYGYKSKISESSLPDITAQIFVDNKYYGTVEIAKSYIASVNNPRIMSSGQMDKYSFSIYDERDYGLIVTQNRWKKDDNLFVPYLQIDVLNQTLEVKSGLTVKVVFYDLENSKIWGEASSVVVQSDKKLLPGFMKTAFVSASQGYSTQLDTSSLPKISAEVFVNGVLYGQVEILRSYDASSRHDLIKMGTIDTTISSFVRKNEMDFYPLITANCWSQSQNLYVPYLKIDITNQQEVPANNIKVKAIFTDKVNKVSWSEITDSLISAGETPLKKGFKKTSFIRASRGYRGRIDESSLPVIVAEVFINDAYYGETTIKQSYDSSKIEQELKISENDADEEYVRIDERPFYPIVKAKHWENVGGQFSIWTGRRSDDLYGPSVQIDIVNQEEAPAKNISVKAIFYDLNNKNLWSHTSENIISSSDTPLKQGYHKTAFLKSSVGYRSRISESGLPKIVAEIYINDSFYGIVEVDRTFSFKSYDYPLTKDALEFENDFVKKNSMDFFPVVREHDWQKNQTIYAPFIRLDITNQLEVFVKSISVKAIFYNESKKELWSEAVVSAVSSSVPLRPGFNVSAFLKASQGFNNMISKESLPDITADIYINNQFYGTVKVDKIYNGNTVEEPLVNDISKEEDEKLLSKSWNAASFLGERGYSTSKSDSQRQTILKNAVNDYGKQRIIDHISFLVNMRLAQENGETKYANAISKWRSDLAFVRNL